MPGLRYATLAARGTSPQFSRFVQLLHEEDCMSSAPSLSDQRAISGIIPTVGRPELLRLCLASIIRQTIPVAEVLVVHCGDDAATKTVVTEPVWQKAGLNSRYFHFAEPNAAQQRDFAISHAKYENLLLLDDDVELDPAWAQELFNPIWNDPRVGATMGRLVNQPMAAPTPIWRLYRRLLVRESERSEPGRLVGAVLPNGFPVEAAEPMATEWIGGGASAMTRRAYHSVGGFAPYFTGSSPGEDLDLGYRLSRKWRVLYVPAAKCVHHSAQQRRERLDRHQYLSMRSRFVIQICAMGRGRALALWHIALWTLFQSASELLALRKGSTQSSLPLAWWGRSKGLASCLFWQPPPASVSPVKRKGSHC
jgi:GT2 family glycosyltransferase